MSTQPTRIIWLILSAALWSAPLATPAFAFPPPKAPPNTAVYKMTTKTVHNGKTETQKDTVTIAVVGNRSSRKQGDGQVAIYDVQAKTITTYGGKSKEKVAQQRAMADMSPWELGYQGLAADSKAPPKENGKGTYGGEACTVVQFDTRKLGNPELCITDKGIVARYVERAADGGETIYEAEKITISAPAADTFEIPKDLQLRKD